MKNLLLLVIFLMSCFKALAQSADKPQSSDSIFFESPRIIDPALKSVDSITFHQFIKGSKILGEWTENCCFHGMDYGAHGIDPNVKIFVVAREGKYRPYFVLVTSHQETGWIDELLLSKHFVDGGEALIITSQVKSGIIERLTLDYNVGYEPFYKQIKSTFRIAKNGKIETLSSEEHMKRN
jgi:hypothetical protein